MWTFVDIEKSADGYSTGEISLSDRFYSFFTQPCDIKQSLLNLNLFYLFVKRRKELVE